MAYTIRKILEENWSDFCNNNPVTDYQKKEVEKMIHCSKHSCNSRICSSCGKRYTDQWSEQLKHYLFPIKHKHIVLTVPAILRPTLRDWNNIKIFMDSSALFLKNIFKAKVLP
ncbi:MAG: transposase zinc-binding domain-containing protein [Nanoarchaeota archaeon]|nr:transposase zinc-binding domain-containing protein [Nanoarchaeota archaeon]